MAVERNKKPKDKKSSKQKSEEIIPNCQSPELTLFTKLFLKRFEEIGERFVKNIENENVSSKICLQSHCYFVCESDECDVNSWTSNRSWITVDLAKPGVLRRYRQKCRNCNQPSWPRVPWNEITDFINTAINIYENRCKGIGRLPAEKCGTRKDGAKNRSHIKELCEKCGYGKRDC